MAFFSGSRYRPGQEPSYSPTLLDPNGNVNSPDAPFNPNGGYNSQPDGQQFWQSGAGSASIPKPSSDDVGPLKLPPQAPTNPPVSARSMDGVIGDSGGFNDTRSRTQNRNLRYLAQPDGEMPEPQLPPVAPPPEPSRPAATVPQTSAAAIATPAPNAQQNTPDPGSQRVEQITKDLLQYQKPKGEGGKNPGVPASNWESRLGNALLAMTKLRGAASQILHPKWTAEMQAYEAGLQSQENQLKEAQQSENIETQAESRQAMAEQRRAMAVTNKERASALENAPAEKAALEKRKIQEDAQKVYDAEMKRLGVMNAQPLADGETAPPGWAQTPLTNPANGQNETWVHMPLMASIQMEDPALADEAVKRGLMTQDQVTQPLTPTARKSYRDRIAKMQEAELAASFKPPKPEIPKQAFQEIISKIAPGLPQGALTDVNKMASSIKISPALTQEEKSTALAYLAANTTPAAQGTNQILRVEGMAQTREYPVINKSTHAMEMRSASDINSNPGIYAPAGAGAQAMSKEAIFQDLHYNINTARKAIQALESMDGKTRVELAYALRHTDPSSAIASFLTGSAGQTMSPQEQEAAQALALLSENAMSLRSVAGMGQGSDDLRSAIQATIPGAKSPSKGYALSQLEKFEQVVNRIERGVPVMTAPGATPPGGAPAPASAPAVSDPADLRRFLPKK